jgi:thiol-disulfide isomerase/thioredoxin
VSVISPGSPAPPVPGVELRGAPQVLYFYKVTCPVCQMAAPAVQAFDRAYPGHIAGIGQDPPEKLAQFGDRFGQEFVTHPDSPPYPASVAYGIRVVPTAVLVDEGGVVADVVESWDRDGLNRVSRRVADLTGLPYAPISELGDGLPPFRPG